jgi:Ca-activated chloride channel family protein
LIAALCFSQASDAAPPKDTTTVQQWTGVINGVVKDSKTKEKIENAIVILQCTCLKEQREARTNASGIYAFRNLPPGQYTIQVLSGKANVSKIATLPRGAKFRANFSLDPKNEFVRKIQVNARPVRRSAAGRTIRMDSAKNLPVGSSTRRDFTATVDTSAGAYRSGSQSFRHRSERWNRESYRRVDENGWYSAADRPLSTFSIDVDTASYSNVRRFLDQGSLPPQDAVRIEELINYFDYDTPRVGESRPFVVAAEVGPSPWNKGKKLVRISMRAKDLDPKNLPPRNLVFLVDVSGSMQSEDKLPLLKRSLHLVVDQMRPKDHVSLVVYAGAAGVALNPTSGADKRTIRQAIDGLAAGGSTNGAGGIRAAYGLAKQNFHKEGINRVVLGTDGDFNVGTTSHGELTRLIEQKRETGVFLSVLGFGTGNLQDDRMEGLADRGNGNYAYIDTVREAEKVLVKESGGTLVTLAKDVKLQIEFNPQRVESYRLVGYENRKLKAKDFDDDKKDAGELGLGHDVTALYEVTPRNLQKKRKTRKLRYQSKRGATREAVTDELMLIKLRYKTPRGKRSKLEQFVLKDRDVALARTTDDFRFAAAVATFGMLLRKSKHRGQADWDDARRLASGSMGKDQNGYRAEFLSLVRRAESLSGH